MLTDTTTIAEGMDVFCTCGTRIGKVDHVEGDRVKLAKNDTISGGKHHWVPLDWVDRVDNRVHLNVDAGEARDGWHEDAP
jgi:hypothetical protein